jgi:HK97 gp10 family phage protein
MAYVESGVYVEGLNAMVAGLTAMSSEATSEVQALNRKVGIMVRDEAKSNLAQTLIPGSKSTGDLAGSIRYSKGLYGAFIFAGNNSVPYANVQNWGWFYDKKNFFNKNIKPKQFVNKAAASVRKEVQKFYVDELIKIYEKYSGKTGNVKVNDFTTKAPTVGRRY